MELIDPVHAEDGLWWFWDETWVNRLGPYLDEREAREACDRYALYLETGEDWYS